MQSVREYGTYQKSIIQIVENTLDSFNIPYVLVDVKQACNQSLSSDTLLVVYTQDYLDGRYMSYNGHDLSYSELVTILSSYNHHSLVLTSVFQGDADFQHVKENVHFLHYGGDILFQMHEYPQLTPQQFKNFSCDFHWISLSRCNRIHREIAACYLLGQNLGDLTSPANRGLCRISDHKILQLKSWQEYLQTQYNYSYSVSPKEDEILQIGFKKFKEGRNGGQPVCNIYEGLKGCDNATNFDLRLRELYKCSLVEIVNETTFFSNGIFVTEKFLNSVYGFNLPIVLSNQGTVNYLRTNGFDLCDDVIDHSYDKIKDPLRRIIGAIDDNIELLTDSDYAEKCWKSCLPKLKKNYQYAKSNMYIHFRNQFCSDLQSYVQSLRQHFLDIQ